MKRPTVQQLKQYADSIGFTDFDPQAFLDRYDAAGWKYGNTKITNWMACVRTWKRNAAKFSRSGPRSHKPAPLPYHVRQRRINLLNKRKAELMRVEQTPEVERELERIRIQLFDL